MANQIQIETVRALKDNYCYVIHRLGSRKAIVVDPSESAPIEAALDKLGLELGLILNTHHHHDHVDGNSDLLHTASVPVYCSRYDLSRIPGATRGFTDGENFEFDGLACEVLEIPGHTLGQIAFYFADANALFVGDTLFSMGCGRLFEGTAKQMFESLNHIASLPAETRIYFGHEYTETNGRFAQSVEPGNEGVARRIESVRSQLSLRNFSEAPTLASEREVNPFLRTSSPEIRARLNLESATDLDVFTRLREIRNTF